MLVVAIVAYRHRRRAAAEQRRLAALAGLAETMTELSEQLRRTTSTTRGPREPDRTPPVRPTPPLVGGLPGRTALLELLVADVDVAQRSEARLAIAVMSVTSTGPEEAALVDAAHVLGEVSGEQVHRTGSTSLAVVLPGRGRAEALAVIARTEATLRARSGTGRPRLAESAAVELGRDEDAVGLLARAASA